MSKIIPRLHQSYSGYLLGRNGRTPLELQSVIASGRVPTKPMEEGSLVDQLLFGGCNYQEIGKCTKRSGPDKGAVFDPTDYSSKDAQEQRDAIRSEGRIPVFAHEVDTARAQAQAIREALARNGVDLHNMHVRCHGEPMFAARPEPAEYSQVQIDWTSKLGVRCAGTLDILSIRRLGGLWFILDTKLSARADQEFLERQAAAMGWDVQAAAYIEACELGLGLSRDDFGGYGLAVCEKRSGLHMACVRWLSDVYLRCGSEQWEVCQERWQEIICARDWPGLEDGALEPPGWYVSRIFDTPESGDLADIGVDMTGIEVVNG